ncbi:hypothetical protein HME9304_01924 [Flagellimonas maritima]|uniref:Uncharacterized protein n=1 Tax=Flagellimonas maritima TaxID=1383885 RepID=A0A2Z4LU77_9FLAO|nr:hypothetical protein [Allomuricauda aurantiaca]AWX44918.1 hypothetical protein HME9304_01924 [Allomuricauda aurantiaca]
MKIRIKGNSIRYRLTRTEVETFCKEGSYVEKTDFGSSEFVYKVVAKKGIQGLEAIFNNNTITLLFPFAETKKWAKSDRIGYEDIFVLENGKDLKLLLEKDFVCMDETIEDQSDNYPNPKKM